MGNWYSFTVIEDRSFYADSEAEAWQKLENAYPDYREAQLDRTYGTLGKVDSDA